MREKIPLSCLPYPRGKETIALQKQGNPDCIFLFWDCATDKLHLGAVRQERFTGTFRKRRHFALLAERKGKVMTLFVEKSEEF